MKTAVIFPTTRLNAAGLSGCHSQIYLLTPRPSMPPAAVIARGELPGGHSAGSFRWRLGLEPELVARIAPVITEILQRTTKHQIELANATEPVDVAT